MPGDAGTCPWFVLLKTPQVSSTRTPDRKDTEMFPSAYACWFFSFFFLIVSSHLPAWHVQPLFLLLPVDIWIIASLLVQQSSWHPCSSSALAALPAKQAHQPASVWFQQWFQDPRSPFNLSVQKQHLKKWNPGACPEKLAAVCIVLPSKLLSG